MNATESLEYEQPCILNEVIEACNKEEVIDKHLQHVQSMSLCTSHIPLAEYMYTIIMAEMTIAIGQIWPCYKVLSITFIHIQPSLE